MRTLYGITVYDWADEKWAFTGRDVELEKRGEWSEENQDGVGVDDHVPMMLCAYPLRERPSNKSIRRIHEKTCLTVVEDTETGEFFLALCGGGMDLSQDIAMAYIIAHGLVPAALAMEVSTQPNLSQRGKNWLQVMRYCRRALLAEATGARRHVERISEALRKARMRQTAGGKPPFPGGVREWTYIPKRAAR